MGFYDQEILRSITNNLSEDKESYKKFFNAAMKKFGVKSPLELPDEKKKEFYNYIDNNYAAKNEGTINEASSVKFEVHSDPDKTERSFVAGFKELAKGHGSIIDYGPRETDSYDWNDRSNYESAKKEYNVYMKKIAMRLNSTVHDMNQIYKVWDKISTKYRKKDKMNEGLLNEIPASVFSAAAAVTMKNPKTGKDTKVSTAVKDKDHPLYQKAMSWIKSHTKDKKKDEPKKAAPKKQSKSDADFWKKQYGVSESAPEGWEGTVKAMKGEPGIDNPYALAHWMKNKGYKSHKSECIEILTKLKERSQNKNLKETVKEVAMPLGSYLEHALADVGHMIDVVKGDHAEDAYQNAKKSSKLLVAAFKLLKKVK